MRERCLRGEPREGFLDRINKINRILAWRTGDTEDGFWHGEQEKQEEDWGCRTPH